MMQPVGYGAEPGGDGSEPARCASDSWLGFGDVMEAAQG